MIEVRQQDWMMLNSSINTGIHLVDLFLRSAQSVKDNILYNNGSKRHFKSKDIINSWGNLTNQLKMQEKIISDWEFESNCPSYWLLLLTFTMSFGTIIIHTMSLNQNTLIVVKYAGVASQVVFVWYKMAAAATAIANLVISKCQQFGKVILLFPCHFIFKGSFRKSFSYFSVYKL